MPEELLHGQEHGFGMQEAFPGEGFAGHHWGLQGVSEVAQEERGRAEECRGATLGLPTQGGSRRGCSVWNQFNEEVGDSDKCHGSPSRIGHDHLVCNWKPLECCKERLQCSGMVRWAVANL